MTVDTEVEGERPRDRAHGQDRRITQVPAMQNTVAAMLENTAPRQQIARVAVIVVRMEQNPTARMVIGCLPWQWPRTAQDLAMTRTTMAVRAETAALSMKPKS